MYTEAQIDGALARIAQGLRTYCWIQNNLHRVDASQDLEFQTRYHGFYKLRGRDAGWRACYFELLEQGKSQPVLSFSQILGTLRERTGKIEASFTSKLIATLDPSKPVIDIHVLKWFGLRKPAQKAKDREAKTVALYQCLCRRYEEEMSKPDVHNIYRKFSEAYPWANISDLKKIDLVLWQIRP